MSNRSPAKAALRARIATALSAIAPADIATQSAAVLAQLQNIPAYKTCTSASIYLPMAASVGGREIDTWPIVADLLSRGARVAVPKVMGKQPTDMCMLRLSSLEQAQGFPKTKWHIPEPDAEAAAGMEVATEASDLSLLLVPAVAFDTRMGRLGHGRGYYDAFIKRQRALSRGGGDRSEGGKGSAPLQVIGLALREQVVDDPVPMVEGVDERMDLVLTPDVRAHVSAENRAALQARPRARPRTHTRSA